MVQQTFTFYLLQRYDASRRALIGALENRDQLLYVTAPALRQEYMEKIGNEEETVLETELDTFLLERKKDLIQRSINRGEDPDIDAIDRQVEEEKQEKIADMELEDKTLNEQPELSDEDQERLNRLYHNIVERFHPQVNPEVSDVQKELYEKALGAFKLQGLQEMQVIHSMLFDEYAFGNHLEKAVQEYKVLKEAGLLEAKEEKTNEKQKFEQLRNDLGVTLASDYSFAGELFDAFQKDENDLEILNYIDETMQQVKEILDECEELKKQFPFNAQRTLESKAETQAYLDQLKVRASISASKKSELEKKIEQLLKEVAENQ